MAGNCGVYAHISGAATTVVRTGFGVLQKIIVGTSAAGTATVYDNTAGSGTVIAVITSAAAQAPVCLEFDCAFTTGLTVVTTAATDLTVVVG